MKWVGLARVRKKMKKLETEDKINKDRIDDVTIIGNKLVEFLQTEKQN